MIPLAPAARRSPTAFPPLLDPTQVGYMIGTGVMVGLPGQTLKDLAGDILFFKEIGANMIGETCRPCWPRFSWNGAATVRDGAVTVP